MNEQVNGFGTVVLKNYEQAMDVLKRLFDVASPGAVFSDPVSAGEQMVITAAEVTVGLGLGVGAGGDNQGDGGSGGGAGGGSMGRPVAVITVSPRGVHVEPVVDVTKIALAFFTMLGAMIIARNRMRRASKR